MPDALAPPPIDLTTRTLDNGLRVVVHRLPASPLAAVNLWYDVGARHEVEGRTGFAHLFEHLMFQGSANVAAGDHFKLLEGVGATLNATTGTDRTNYFETVPVEHLDLALWLEADRMGSLDVSQQNLDTQRDVVKEEKRQRYDNQPAGTFWLDILANLFPDGHPYHHAPIGSMEDLDAATLDDVVAFHRKWYGPDNAVLSIVADLDPEDVLTRVERFFGGIDPLGGTPGAPDGSLERIPLAEARSVDLADTVATPAVCPTWRVPQLDHPDLDAVQVAAVVLGRGRGCRLNRALVLDEHLALPASSFLQVLPLVGGAGICLGRIDLRDGVDRRRGEDVLAAEVSALADQAPTDDEVTRAKALVSSSWLGRLGSGTALADDLGRVTTQWGDPERINHELDGILAVTPDDVRRVADAYLRPDRMVTLTYLPADHPDAQAARDGAAA